MLSCRFVWGDGIFSGACWIWHCCRIPVGDTNMLDPISLPAGSEAYYCCWYSSYACWSTSAMLAERSSSKTNLRRDCGYTEFHKRGSFHAKIYMHFVCFLFNFVFFLLLPGGLEFWASQETFRSISLWEEARLLMRQFCLVFYAFSLLPFLIFHRSYTFFQKFSVVGHSSVIASEYGHMSFLCSFWGGLLHFLTFD